MHRQGESEIVLFYTPITLCMEHINSCFGRVGVGKVQESIQRYGEHANKQHKQCKQVLVHFSTTSSQ